MSNFTLKANVKEIADRLGQSTDSLAYRVIKEVEALSASTHAFVVRYANEKLKDRHRNLFFGENNQNVRWNQVAPNIWVVEIDESVAWIEEGREPTSMATDKWLLKPGSKGLKRAKDGSMYKVIPFTHARGAGGSMNSPNPEIASTIKKELKDKGINLRTLDRDDKGNVKLGVVSKLGINKSRSSYPQSLFSEPRNNTTAKHLGLPSHHGHHFLKNAVVVQRQQGNKVSKEVVTFRVVSSKHQAEGRWMYPRVEPLNSIPEAHKYALNEWDKIVKTIEKEFESNVE